MLCGNNKMVCFIKGYIYIEGLFLVKVYLAVNFPRLGKKV